MKKNFCLFIAFLLLVSISWQMNAQTKNPEMKIRQSDISSVKEEVAN
jgi:hypothetical protein